MTSTLATDLRLYVRLARMQIRSQLRYRASTAVEIGTYFTVSALEFMQIFLLFATFSTLAGWNAGQVALIYALTSLCFGLSEMFGSGFDNFTDVVRRGEFDRVLTRPVSPLLQVASDDFRLRRVGRITVGVLAFWLALRLLGGIVWSPDKALAVMAGIFSGTVIFVSVFLLGAAACFWTVETTELTNILTYGGREMLSWPLSAYHEIIQRAFLFVVPLAFGAFVPACYVLGKPLPFGLPAGVVFLAPPLAVAFGALSVGVWQAGVRHYQSTGT